MASSDKPNPTQPDPPEAGDAESSGEARTWRDLWQAPALLAGVALLVGGVAYAIASRPAPDFAGILDVAESQVERERFEDAIATLNGQFFPHYDDARVNEIDRRRYHVLLGRSIYHGQRALGVSLDANYQASLGEFLEAERREASLTPGDTFLLADSLVQLGLFERAIRRRDRLPDDRLDLRVRLTKSLIAKELAKTRPDQDLVLEQLGAMLADGGLERADRIWAIGRQAEILLRQGYAEAVIDRILRAMPRLASEDDRDLLEFYVKLGEAYVEVGAFDAARQRLDRAAEIADGTGLLWGRIQLLLGQSDAEMGRLAEARDRHASIVRNHGQSDDLLPNLMALGETEAALGRATASAEAYERLVREIELGRGHPSTTIEAITASLMERFIERFDAGQAEEARRYALIAERLWGVESAPKEVVLALARAHERLANEAMPVSNATTVRLTEASLDPATRELVRPLLIAAGAYFSQHAEMVVGEPALRGESLWSAAMAFDRAGQQTDAISAYERYAEGYPDSPRRPEARYRLAQAYHARGDHDRATAEFRELIRIGVDRSGDKGVGVWADRSYVPLAQSLLMDDDPSNDEEAGRLLMVVVDGRLSSPESNEYPLALLELGRLHHRAGEHPRAIERLEEMRTRYPDHPSAGNALFWLADAYRMEANAIEQTLDGALPATQRAELEVTRRQRLERAGGLYDEVVTTLGAKPSSRRTDLDNLYLRNAHFFRGDAAFDLGQYDAAIRHYDAARLAYRDDPASLVAMVQIVNAHVEQGDYARAETANERARYFFRQLPDEVWDDPTLPMSREDWERWLDSSSRLYALDRAD